MSYPKKKLIAIAQKIETKKKITVSDIDLISHFEKKEDEKPFIRLLKKLAVPVSLAFGFFFSAFPDYVAEIVKTMPHWTNLDTPVLTGIDYLWDILGEPVRKANIIYHIPNIILYSFGVFGAKKLFDAIDKKTWLDRVIIAREKLQGQLSQGTTNFLLKTGHSILFVGKGDFIGMQFIHNHTPDNAITISENKPRDTVIWNYYNTETTYQDLKDILYRADTEHAGEYIFFPVKDDQIFLPNETAYDVSPHKLDILCQNIRMIEKEEKWGTKRILILGDKFHQDIVQSEDEKTIIETSTDVISLSSIATKYQKVTLLDPTDIVLKKILTIAKGRKIVFRATKAGITEYKKRFYERLKDLGYTTSHKKKGILTIGYDLLEDQTEQQTLARTIDDYYPIVLSKTVRDALIRNGYKEQEFIYVPDLVLQELTQKASEQ